MLYEIEFVRQGDGKGEMIAEATVRLVSETLTDAIIKAHELFRNTAAASPRPEGYRIRESHREAILYQHPPAPRVDPTIATEAPRETL